MKPVLTILLSVCCIPDQARAAIRDYCSFSHATDNMVCARLVAGVTRDSVYYGLVHFESEAKLYDLETDRLRERDTMLQMDFPLAADTARLLYLKVSALYCKRDSALITAMADWHKRWTVNHATGHSIARGCQGVNEYLSWAALESMPDSLPGILQLREAHADIAALKVIPWRERKFLLALPKGQFRTCSQYGFRNFSYREAPRVEKSRFRLRKSRRVQPQPIEDVL